MTLCYSAPRDPLVALRGPTSKGRGGGREEWGGPRGREGWGGERKGGEGMEGRGQAPQNSGSRRLEPPLLLFPTRK